MSHDLTLPAELTIYTIGELHPRCVALAAAGATSSTDQVTFDASGVDEVDAAGLQLLLSLSNALARHGRTLRLEAPSAVLAAACRSLGVSDTLIGATGATA